MGIFDRFNKPKNSITLDQLMQENYEQKHFKECKDIWQKYVPKQGQSNVLQGELLRQIEKLRCEAKDNGNINWDEDFTFFCEFIKGVLCNQEIYSDDEKTRITVALDCIKKCGEYANRYNNGQISDDEVNMNKTAYVEDNLYDIVADAIGKFQLNNPEPIPHAKLDHVKR